jgi:PBP1b-binding outer membrane lipoprotein LpoB
MKRLLFILTIALLVAGCASKAALQKSPCACEPDLRFDQSYYERS